jgi:hypothetical protein
MATRFAVPMACVLAGCATSPQAPKKIQKTPGTVDCVTLIESVDKSVAGVGRRWPSAHPIPGYPGLRSDRFLAAIGESAVEPATAGVWLDALRDLDRHARQLELPRLPASDRARLKPPGASLASAVESCAERLKAALATDQDSLSHLVEAARVPDDYSTVARTLGLYPLTMIPVAEGVRRLHNRTRDRFAHPSGDPGVGARWVRYGLSEPPPDAQLAVSNRFDVLGRPSLSKAHLQALFTQHAPIWEIADGGDYDRPGEPFWQGPAVPGLRTGDVVIYTYPSWALWHQQVLLQLNYVIWFSERPSAGPLDILAGPLDGLLWRVTLLPDGRPLVYDSIHPCGCYHMLFPKPGLQLTASALEQPEPPLIAAPAPSWQPSTRVVLKIATRTHYLSGVHRDSAGWDQSYRLQAYDVLDQTPDGDGLPVGLFAPDGLVPGTVRPERFVLWPMGIASAGAMRARGRQPVAFIGRRHFDDPFLFQNMFRLPSADP